jgi:hypothetical protein
MAAIRSIIIDPFRGEVREAEIANSLEELQFIVGGGYIEHGIWINHKDILYVSDFAFWPERFIIGGVRAFSGCGVIIGSSGSGKARSAKVSLREIQKVVQFPSAAAAFDHGSK